MKNPFRSFAAVSAAVLMIATSCELPPLYEVWGDFKSGELDITPSFVTLEETKSVTLTVTGGRAPYDYLDISGDGILTSLNGHAEYTAPDLGADDSRWILVTDSKGNQVEAEVLVTVAPVPLLRISPTTISISTTDTATFTPSGGKIPYTYSRIPEVGTVAPMMGMSTVYTPSVATTVVIRVTDASGQVADATVYVSDGDPPLVIDPSNIQITTAQTATLTPSGGEAPYTYSVISGTGDLAPLTGPSTVFSPVGVTVAQVRVTDNLGQFSTATISVVDPAPGLPLAIVPRSINVTMGTSFQFTAEGGDGTYIYTISGYGGTVDEVTGLYTAPTSRQGIEYVIVTDGRGVMDTATVKVKKK